MPVISIVASARDAIPLVAPASLLAECPLHSA